MMRGQANLAIPLRAVLLFAGCGGPPSAADRSYVGMPECGGGSVDPDAGESVAAAWIEKDESFAIATWGSSSCPAVPTSIETTDAGGVDVRFDSTTTSGPCTADMAPTMHDFTVSDDAETVHLVITVRWVDWDQITDLTLE